MAALDESLIDRIYDAVAEPDGWSHALSGIAGLTGAGGALLHEFRGDVATVFGFHGDLDVKIVDICETVYRHRNPWMKSVLRAPPHRLINLEDHLPHATLQRTAFYADVLAPQRQDHAVGGIAYCRPDCTVTLYLGRSRREGPFDQDDETPARKIMPHLRRALTLRHKMPSYGSLTAGMTALVDLLPHGIVLLNGEAQVVFVNRRALAIMRRDDTLRIIGNRLVADREGGQRLMELARTASRGEPGGIVAFERDQADRLVVLVSPLRGRSTTVLDELSASQGRGAAIFIREPLLELPPSERLLVQLYGLTTAEARLMAVLSDGTTIQEAALHLGIKISTAKTHLKHLFAKTGADRQAALVRMAATLPQIHDELPFRPAASPH